MADDKTISEVDKTISEVDTRDLTPELDKNDNVILSKDVRDQQKAEGFVPDIQPKCVPAAMVPATGVVGSATGGVGAMQPTGNILVQAAQYTPVEEPVKDAAKDSK